MNFLVRFLAFVAFVSVLLGSAVAFGSVETTVEVLSYIVRAFAALVSAIL